jgi:hypothetical protein
VVIRKRGSETLPRPHKPAAIPAAFWLLEQAKPARIVPPIRVAAPKYEDMTGERLLLAHRLAIALRCKRCLRSVFYGNAQHRAGSI